MRVVGVTEFGGPEVLGILDLPEPHPGEGEARIRVRAFAVSPTDLILRSGESDTSAASGPYIPGMDAAGVIDEVGESSSWRVGDKVMAIALPLSAHGGAYAEYLVGPDVSMSLIPEGFSLEQAATVPMNGLTAMQILERAGLEPGQLIAVTGAAGTLGGYVVQLAKAQNLTVIADAAAKDRERVSSLGADHVVERGDDFADRVRELYPDGVDAVADTALLHEKIVPAVRDGGAFISVRGWTGNPERRIRFEAASVGLEYRSYAKLDALRQAVEDGDLVPRIAGVFPAEETAEAHRRLEAGGARGRFVLTF
ncbi:NADP-dependent oxidoreductase [Microbacterium sp. 22303]|uniref:NADP-dependent oxidoreductase n=1 Tax=Microbacterium sp. 22303 TaxID=3453905 RepID=UPI003F831FA7